MIWDAWMYKNPETVAIRKQEDALRKAKACGDCIHRQSIDFRGETWHACTYKRRVYGIRCELFETKRETP